MTHRLIGIATIGLVSIVAWAQEGGTFGAATVQAHERAIVLKGEGVLDDATLTISLPSWFETEAKTTGRVVTVTCKGGFSPLIASAVSGGQFTISTNETGSPTQAFYWVLIADRN